ncbi:MAG TPA: cardiolipin synthase [Gemmataceae bacterium]|nr:cardiolipin synthase [Gemmataceae bacterium]
MGAMLSEYWPHLTIAFSMLDVVLLLVFLPWILLSKKDATATVAWCLLVVFLPLAGAFCFWAFGYNYLLHRVRHRRGEHMGHRRHPRPDGLPHQTDRGEHDLGELAERVNAYPMRRGNALTVYHETTDAFNALLDAIELARQYIHLEYFILRSDATGDRLYELLARKAKEGVEVRLLFDAMGSLHLKGRSLRPLREAGAQVAAFLPLNPLHSLIRVNLRNHRKITVVDGRVGFTGGMNIGDEYLGKSTTFGYWRDSFLRLEGPAVADLQRVFSEDWGFVRRELLSEEKYTPPQPDAGDVAVQIADSGPDQEVNTIREIYFLAIISARRRLWIASPYLVPDNGLFDALRAARYRGIDVRILTLLRPDHYISYYAGLYYAAELLAYGVKIYLYRKGMMHAKLMMVDGRWGMVGSANLDNRSLHLNFEVGCILHDAAQVEQLEAVYQRDLDDAVPLDQQTLAARSLTSRALENACRLFTPAL